MRSALDLLSRYAAYHRDQRNIATHIVGIPLIVFSIGVLLARPSFDWLGLVLSPAWLLWGATAGWYLIRGRFVLGLAVSLLNALLVALAQPLAALSTAAWLAWGTGCFVLGWLVQFAGHWYEGRRPAFFDERVGLLVGPMFVTAEALFALGWNPPLLREIERRVGPTHLRDLASMHPS